MIECILGSGQPHGTMRKPKHRDLAGVPARLSAQSDWYDRKTRRARSVVREHPSICRVRVAPHRVPGLRERDARAARLSFGPPFDTKRVGVVVGQHCRAASIPDVAKECHLDWHTVKERDKHSRQAQLDRTGKPAPTGIGVDELSIRKTSPNRIVVSDLVRARPIWVRGERIAPRHVCSSSLTRLARGTPRVSGSR
jgi:hypothetical protein